MATINSKKIIIANKDVLEFLLMTNRVVFMGTPEFAVPALMGLAEKFSICGVVSQPDRPSGRGKALTPPPVKEAAQKLGLPIFQPEDLAKDGLYTIADWEPDVIVVVAFGQILTKEVLHLPKIGCVNIHGSILPRWRGASPIQAAILAGDTETGVTIMQMDEGVDTGGIYSFQKDVIKPDDTSETLSLRLSMIGGNLLVDTLPEIISGKLLPKPQPEYLATYCDRIEKQQGILDLNQPAEFLERKVRAFNPWPSTWFNWKNEMIKVHKAHIGPGVTNPGERGILSNLPALGTGNGWLILDMLQPAGKKSISGGDFLRGARGWSDQ